MGHTKTATTERYQHLHAEHLYEAIVDGGADAVLMASITHFENYTINQMKEYLAGRGIPVNL